MSRRNSFFDVPPSQGPQWSDADFLLDGHVPPDVFPEDAERMRVAAAAYIAGITVKSAPGEHDVHVANGRDNPPGVTIVLHNITQRMGYDVTLVRQTDTPQQPGLSQYASAQDSRAVSRLMNMLGNQPSGRLVRDILTDVQLNSRIFLPGHYTRNLAAERYMGLDGGLDSGYLRRGFMTATLRRFLQAEGQDQANLGLPSWSVLYANEQKLYNLFRGKGLRPYTYSHLTSMLAFAVRGVLSDDPSLWPHRYK